MFLPATDISIYNCKRIMIDANVAIAYFDVTHKFHLPIKKQIQKLYIDGAIFYYPQPVLLELKDY